MEVYIFHAQQNVEQLQNPTMGVTINNESAKTEPPALERTEAKSTGEGGRLNAFYRPDKRRWAVLS